MSEDGYYDLAQICENGHVTNDSANEYRSRNQTHCRRCGARTITQCPECKTDIRGYYHWPGVVSIKEYKAPAFCHHCGEPYPWTAATLRAVEELADEMDALSDDERAVLKQTLPDLVMETPRVRLAETRFKKLMRKAGAEGVEAMRALLTDLVSETVRKTLFGGF